LGIHLQDTGSAAGRLPSRALLQLAPGAARSCLVADVFKKYSAERASKRRPNTIRNDRGFLQFCESAGVTRLSQITLDSALVWEDDRSEMADSTRRNELKATLRVLRWCVDHDLLDENPLEKYRLESTREDANPHRAFSLDELKAIIAACHPPLDLMVKAFVVTGLRRTEMCNITWEMIDWDEGLIRLPGSITKTKAGRFAVLGPRLVALLREHQVLRHHGGGLVFPTQYGTCAYASMWKSFNRACRRAGIEMDGAHIHSLRVTCATLLYMVLQAPSAIVDLILGHGVVKDPKAPLSIRRYLKARPEQIRPWIEKLEELV